jgi:hypothetical protein
MLQQLSYTQIKGASVNVSSFGAKGDGVTDDSPAFALAYAAAVAGNRALYIPSVASGKFYKLTQALEITQDAFTLFGDGASSMLCAYNATGLNAITVLADHVTVRNLAITGIAGSGHGLQCGTSAGTTAYYGTYENLWISWMGGNCLDIQLAISSVFIAINLDHEIIPNPVTLTSVTKGARLNGINIRKVASGNNGNLTFLGCIVNAAYDSTSLTNWEVQIGEEGTGSIFNINWTGGLIQSYPNLINLNGVSQVYFAQVYSEPSVSPGTITVANSTAVQFDNCFLDANITYTGTSSNNSVRNSYINAVTNSTTFQNVIDNVIFGSVGGKLIDFSGKMKATSTINASNSQMAVGINFSAPYNLYFQTNMQNWLGGGAPSTPSGLTNTGATITREAAIKRTGDYSAKVICGAANFDSGLKISIPNEVISVNGDIVVEAWVKNGTSGKTPAIAAWFDSGASTPTMALDATSTDWQRIVVRFNAAPTGTYTNGYILFTGTATDTFYWDSIRITLENYTPINTKTLSASGTPDISIIGTSGPQLNYVITEATIANVTGFTGQEVGKPFTVVSGKTNCTFTDSATMQLAGSVDFVAKTGDTLTLVYGADGVFREVSRSVT